MKKAFIPIIIFSIAFFLFSGCQISMEGPFFLKAVNSTGYIIKIMEIEIWPDQYELFTGIPKGTILDFYYLENGEVEGGNWAWFSSLTINKSYSNFEITTIF